MTRIIIIIFTFLTSTFCMSQPLTFSKTVDSLYFGVDIIKASGFVVDSFMKVQKLHHDDMVIMQSSLTLQIILQTDKKALSARHKFTFSQSPIPELKIDSGFIEVNIGEAEGIKKMLGINWQVDFDNEKVANENFEILKKLFAPLSTTNKYYYDKDIGHIAEFSTTKTADKGIKDITIILSESQDTKKYEISLLLGNDLADK